MPFDVNLPEKGRNGTARSEARTVAFVALFFMFLASLGEAAFCQAGVVAPPDSPDLGNLAIWETLFLVA